jgi:hypothetical protein
MWLGRCRLGGEDADLDQVVGQDAVAGPDSGSFGAVDAGAVPAVATLEGADAAFAPGAPFDCSSERGPVFGGSSGGAGVALAGDHDRTHSQIVQGVLDAFLAVATVGGHGGGRAPGACGDPYHGGHQLWRVGRIAPMHNVIDHDPVIVVDDQGFVPELDWPAQPAFGDRAGIGIVQADPPRRPVGNALGRLR